MPDNLYAIHMEIVAHPENWKKKLRKQFHCLLVFLSLKTSQKYKYVDDIRLYRKKKKREALHVSSYSKEVNIYRLANFMIPQ